MAAHPESGAKAREILNEYIDLRYRTYGDMEDVDPEFACSQRESIRQHVGQRLMSELPPAQGAVHSAPTPETLAPCRLRRPAIT